jgi:hypothetical protein
MCRVIFSGGGARAIGKHSSKKGRNFFPTFAHLRTSFSAATCERLD